MFKNNLLQLICFTLVILSFCQLALCRPSEVTNSNEDDRIDPSDYPGNLSKEVIRKIQQCDRDLDTMELCMRCAKVTKAVDVYPLCCVNEDKVKDWCEDYIYYGLQ